MDAFISQLGAIGIAVAILLGGLKWMASQYERLSQRLEANASECLKREERLAERLTLLEDRRNADLQTIVQSTMETLRLNAHAMAENSGAFKALADETAVMRRRFERREVTTESAIERKHDA